MVDFSFTEEQELFRQSVREWAQKTLPPERIREIDKGPKIPTDIIKEMAKMGLHAPTIPTEYGGMGADMVTACIAAEEIARQDITIAVPVYYLLNAGWAKIVDLFGTEQLKEELFPKAVKGEAFIGIATTESSGGSDIVGATRTVMRKEGNKYIVNGEKMYISGVLETLEIGGGFVTTAYIDKSKGRKGINLFFCPIKDVKGVTPTTVEDMGRSGLSTGGWAMENVEIPDYYLLGEEYKGFYHVMEGFNVARTLVAVTCIGAAEGAIEMGIEYAKQREMFGGPLAALEGFQFQLAKEYSKIQAAKWIVYRAAWMLDQHYQKGKFTASDLNLAVAMAKWLAPIWAFQAMVRVQTWHGAYGYTKECLIEAGIRGVRSYSVGAEGAQDIMRIIIARELLGTEYWRMVKKRQL